jgi:RNA polymerase-associated protein RTF1
MTRRVITRSARQVAARTTSPSSSPRQSPLTFSEDSDDNEGEEEMDMDMDEDMDMDVDSDDDTAAKSRPVNKTNPYPLEGKYIDEDDRD